MVEDESVDLAIMVETSDGASLSEDTDVTLRISDDVNPGSTPIPQDRLIGDITTNGAGDPVVSFTVPMGTDSGSSVSFTGLAIANNEVMENMDLEFLLFIEGFGLLQTSGGGISGFTTVVVEDDDDGKWTYTPELARHHMRAWAKADVQVSAHKCFYLRMPSTGRPS